MQSNSFFSKAKSYKKREREREKAIEREKEGEREKLEQVTDATVFFITR